VLPMKKLLVLLLVLAFPVSGWAQAPANDTEADDLPLDMATTAEDDAFLFEDEEILEVWDPIEPVNRVFFWVNDKLYFYLLKPVARGYRWAVPEPWRVGVKNFFSNLAAPVRIINAGLQGKFGDAGNEITRFAVNTTIGIGGFFDTAKDHFELRMKDEDTGQTMGHYGVGPGPYLVLPILGPSNLRDGVGMFVDNRMNLLYYISEGRTYYGLRVYDKINDLSLDKDTYEGIKKDALDPYLFVRDAFMQYRQNKIEN
jgi:phospholipid-binding lipoprotein MlaA